MEQADVVIVGGGAAGCVLAARLSERATLKVVLLEAGADTPPGAVPEDVADLFRARRRKPRQPVADDEGDRASGRRGASVH